MPMTILLVDDDPVARKVIEQQILAEPRLRPLTARILHAASGEQGLAYFVKERPELVVTDLVMPGMDGFAFCRSVREAPFGREVGLVVLSGPNEDPRVPAELEAQVGAAFVRRPASAAALAEAILSRIPAEPKAGPENGSPPEAREQSDGTQATAAPPFSPPHPGAVAHTATALSGQTAGSGSLAERRIPRLIFELADAGTTGTLAIARGKMRKEIFLRNGEVVAADSNLRQEALGTLLCNKGVIDERQLAYLLAETKARGHKMGAVLIELGWLSPEEVLDCLAAQARKRVVDCLRWNEGTWAFSPGDSFGERVIEHNLDTARTVFMGLFRSATPEALVGRFDQDGDKPIQLTRRFDKYRASFEGVFGAQISPLLASEPSVGSLALREDAQTVIAGVDALLETGLAELGEVSAGTPIESQSDLWEASFSLEKLGSEIASRFDSIRLDAGEELFSQGAHSSSTPRPFTEDSAFARPQAEVDSGVVAWRAFEPAGDASGTAATPSDSPAEAFRQTVLRAYLTVHGKPLYDVLEVPQSATCDDIREAAERMAARFAPEVVEGIDLSPEDSAKLDTIRAAIERASQTLTDPTSRQAYDASLAPAQPAETDPLGAELAFGEAVSLLNSPTPELSLPRFESAVRARPDQALYHAYWAWARFLVRGPSEAQAAREGLQHALELDPDLAEAHTMLGRLAACENDAATARRFLERSLELHADQPDTVDLLVEAYARLDEPREAERFLRKLVANLGESAPALRARLWRELAALHETRLDDRLSARVAYDMAARLAPEDVDLLRKSAALNAEDPSRWRELARALAAEWQLRPDHRAAGEKLLALYRENWPDAVPLATAALVLRGTDDESVRAKAEAARPHRLCTSPAPLPDDTLARLGYGPEEAEIESLVGLLVEAGVIPSTPAEELDMGPGGAVIPQEQPAAFRQTLHAICAMLNVAEPELVLRQPDLGSQASLLHTEPVALLCGPALLESSDVVELGFRLGRALALGTPGRLAGSSRSGGELRPYFLAAMATVRGSLRPESPDDEQAWATVAALEPTARARIAEACQRIMRGQAVVNLSTWTKSLARTANRLALVICGDLLGWGRAVAKEQGQAALEDLLAFALTLDYLDLREQVASGKR